MLLSPARAKYRFVVTAHVIRLVGQLSANSLLLVMLYLPACRPPVSVPSEYEGWSSKDNDGWHNPFPLNPIRSSRSFSNPILSTEWMEIVAGCRSCGISGHSTACKLFRRTTMERCRETSRLRRASFTSKCPLSGPIRSRCVDG